LFFKGDPYISAGRERAADEDTRAIREPFRCVPRNQQVGDEGL
jgi:hypothetical protein